MCVSVLFCFLVICSGVYMSKEVRYECGPHGRFEYCIDGVPGCVVGCHCHPGYYFDTDTKICEPNVKLTQEIRRHYYSEPTPVYDVPSIVPRTEPNPYTTISGNKLNEIPKDTDELGDWLYNQFFKTIESQVISNSNNTKPNNNEKPPTRRSGGDGRPVVGPTKRLKTRRSGRSRKKKHNTKVRGLRRKLLRITEDDSLFDSESDSDSSDSSGSSDSDSSSDGSSEGGDGKKSGSGSEGDKDHGHKKVIIFNRRPKPPLPSFIFLPNMDTPYYPPIGLPPPPPMPMYPMVPVPPMGPPMYPFPGNPKCDEENSTTTMTTIKIPTEKTEVPPNNERRHSKLERHKNVPTDEEDEDGEEFMLRASEPGKQAKLKHAQQNRLMQKLRKKMKEKRKNIGQPTSEGDSDLVVNLDDIPNISDTLPSVKRTKLKKQIHVSQMPNLKDVDFKYLSELIHRVNNSAPKNKPPPPSRNISPKLIPTMPFDNDDLKKLQNLKAHQTRRNFNTLDQVPTRVEPEVVYPGDETRNLNIPSPDDDYYTNLGRQIASMIRNANTNSDHPLNTEQLRPVPFHSVLNENYHSPGSFWERSVRSPLPQISDVKPNTNYLDESRTLKHSNEKNLLNLENEVETYASTAPSLSLQDLENLLNNVEKAQNHIQMKDPLVNTKPSNISLNVNLLPKYVKEGPINRKLYILENENSLNSAEKNQAYLHSKDSLANLNPNPSNLSLNVNLMPNYLRDNNNYKRLLEANNAGILNPQQRAQVYFQLKKSLEHPKSSNVSLSVNFLPDYLRGNHAYRRLYDIDNAGVLSLAKKAQYYFQLKNSLGHPKSSNFSPKVNITPEYLRGNNAYRRLDDMENTDVLSPAEKALYYFQLKNYLGHPKSSNFSLNLNIPPEYLRSENPYRRLFDANNADIRSPVEKTRYYYELLKSLGNPKPSNVSHNLNFLPGYLRGDNPYIKPFGAGNANILNPMEKAQQYFQLKNPLETPEPSNVSLNVQILPKYPRGDIDYRNLYDVDSTDVANLTDKAQYYFPLKNPLESPKPSNFSLNVHLLPKYPRRDIDYRKLYDPEDNTDVANPTDKAQYSFQLKNPLESPKTSNVSRKVHVIPKHAGDDPTYQELVSNTGILNPMEKIQYYSQLKNSLGKPVPSNDNFNGLMIPMYTSDSYRRLYGGDNADSQIPTHTPQPPNIFVESKYITEQYQTLYPPKFLEAPVPAYSSNKTLSHDMDTYNIPQSRDYSMHNNHHAPIQLETETEPKSPVASGYVLQTQKTLQHDNQVQALNQMRQSPFVGVVVPNSFVNKPPPRTEYLQFLNSMPLIKQPSSQNREPKLMNQNNLNYFSRNKYHYMFEKQPYPILAPFRKQISKKYGNPSYFHHHLHHYEYFD